MEIVENDFEPPFYIKLVNRSCNNKLIVDIIHLPKEKSFELEITEYYRYFLFKNRVKVIDENEVNLTEKTDVGVASLKQIEKFVFVGTFDNPYIVELNTLTELGYKRNTYYLRIGLRTYVLEFDKKYRLYVTTRNEKSNEIAFSFSSPNFFQRIYRIIQFRWEEESYFLRYKYREFKKKL